jgi:hypothetical protein
MPVILICKPFPDVSYRPEGVTIVPPGICSQPDYVHTESFLLDWDRMKEEIRILMEETLPLPLPGDAAIGAEGLPFIRESGYVPQNDENGTFRHLHNQTDTIFSRESSERNIT